MILFRLDLDRCLERIRLVRGGEPDLFERREALAKVIDLFEAMDDPQIARIEADQSRDVIQSLVNEAVCRTLLAHRA